MICNSCGNQLRDGALFCPKCGCRQASTRVENTSYTAPHTGAPKGVNCPDCGQFVIYGQERCSCGWNWGRPKVTESPRPSWSSGPASPTKHSYSSAVRPLNVPALVILGVCLLLWLVAPFFQWGDMTALEVISDYDADSVAWQCAAALGFGILISGICVLCKAKGAGAIAALAVVVAILVYILHWTDIGISDFDDLVEMFTEVFAWGWLMIILGLTTVAVIGGKKE